MARQFGEPTIGHAVFGHVDGYPEVYSVAKNRTANAARSAGDQGNLAIETIHVSDPLFVRGA